MKREFASEDSYLFSRVSGKAIWFSDEKAWYIRSALAIIFISYLRKVVSCDLIITAYETNQVSGGSLSTLLLGTRIELVLLFNSFVGIN